MLEAGGCSPGPGEAAPDEARRGAALRAFIWSGDHFGQAACLVKDR
jgi:hypothetical protein